MGADPTSLIYIYLHVEAHGGAHSQAEVPVQVNGPGGTPGTEVVVLCPCAPTGGELPT